MVELASESPVAQVIVDARVPHLDRVFDYGVPAAMADTAVPGARVRVRFSGRLTNGMVVGRLPAPEHPGICGRSNGWSASNPCSLARPSAW